MKEVASDRPATGGDERMRFVLAGARDRRGRAR
jgi:hypothetical protein